MYIKMKKLSTIIIIGIISFLSSCEEEKLTVSNQEEQPFVEVGVSDAAKIKINQFANISGKLRISNRNSIEFDFDELKAIKEVDSDIVTIYAYGKNVDEEGSKYAIGFYEYSNGISNPIIVKTTIPVNGISYIEYYFQDGTKFATFEMNQNNDSINLISQYVEDSSSRVSCSGQDVANCVGDAYARKGWYSVGLFVATAFAPEITLIVVGACGLSVC